MLPRVTLLVITLLGAALRFYGIGHQGFWYDEAYTAAIVKGSFGGMIGLLPHQESTPPAYYVLAWLWVQVFGPGQAGLRSLSALLGTGVIPVSYLTARKLLRDRPAAIIVAALAAFNPLLIWYSQEARAYQMLVLVSACSLLAFAYARERASRRALVLWALAAAAALTTHYYAILLIAPEAGWLLYEHHSRVGVRAAIGSVALVGVALVPLLEAQSRTGNNAWIGRSPLGERLAQVIPLFLLGPQTPARVALKFLAFALALAALALLVIAVRGEHGVSVFTRTTRAVPEASPALARALVRAPASTGASGPPPQTKAPASARTARLAPRPFDLTAAAGAWRGALLPALLTLCGFAISLLAIPVSDTFLARNLLALWLPAALVISAGLGAARARPLTGAITATLCAIGATAALGVAFDDNLQRPNWQPVAQLIGPPTHGRRLVLVEHNPGLMPLALYMPGLKHLHARSRLSGTHVSEIDVISVKDIHGLGGFCWWGSACNLSPSYFGHHYRLPGFRVLRYMHVEQFRIVKLASSRPQEVTPLSIEHLLRDPVLTRDAVLIQP